MKEASKYQRSDYTKTKQSNFTDLLDTHIKIVKGIFSRWGKPPYLYFDFNAGKGHDPDTDEPGSPLIFLDKIKEYGLDYRAHFYEIDPETRAELEVALQPYKETGCDFTIEDDHYKSSKYLPAKALNDRLGLVYVDPSNAQIPVQLLKRFNALYPKVDIVINLACASQKRRSRAIGSPTLVEELNEIGKPLWVISKPVGIHQWSMMLGTGWREYPEFKRWFHKTTSAYGEHILDLLSSTKDERNERYQPPLL